MSHGLSSILNLFPLCLLLKPSAIALLCFIFVFSNNHLILCMFILFYHWYVCVCVCVCALARLCDCSCYACKTLLVAPVFEIEIKRSASKFAWIYVCCNVEWSEALNKLFFRLHRFRPIIANAYISMHNIYTVYKVSHII